MRKDARHTQKLFCNVWRGAHLLESEFDLFRVCGDQVGGLPQQLSQPLGRQVQEAAQAVDLVHRRGNVGAEDPRHVDDEGHSLRSMQ